MKTTWTPRSSQWRARAVVCLAGWLGLAAAMPAQDSSVVPRSKNPPVATDTSPRTASSPADGAARPAIDAVYRLASAATSVGQLESAMQQCAQLRKRQLGSLDLEYVSKLEAWLLNRRGEAYATAAGGAMDSQQDDEAIRLEKLAVADFNASVDREPHWRAYHNRGVSLAMLGQYDDAIASFGEAIDLKPTHFNTRFNRAELWLELARYDLADKDYTEVLRLQPTDFNARMGRGHARFYLTQFDNALADFDAAIHQDSKNSVAYADRADLHAFMGRWEEAAKDYRMAIQLDRGLGRAYQSAAWLMATCPDERYRDVELALRSAQRAVELDGTADYRYLDTLAAAQANAQQFPTAVQSVERAMRAAPPDVRPELQQRLALYQAQRPFRDEHR